MTGLLPHLSSTQEHPLGLPAATLLYLLARDRLGFAPDADALRLALALLKAPADPPKPAFAKCKDKGGIFAIEKPRQSQTLANIGVWEILGQWRKACEQTNPDFTFDVTYENLSV